MVSSEWVVTIGRITAPLGEAKKFGEIHGGLGLITALVILVTGEPLLLIPAAIFAVRAYMWRSGAAQAEHLKQLEQKFSS